MINYAHRGASQYAPENTLAAFYLGLEMGANGIETDIRLTADHQLVLFHDQTMERTAGLAASVEECTYAQLLRIDLGSYISVRYRNERIVLLDDFLKYFAGKEIQLALELKGKGVESGTLDLISRYGCEGHTVVTSFSFDSLKTVRRFDRTVHLGYLTEEIDDDTIKALEMNRIGQICPRASLISPASVHLAHERGLTVRAWGVADESLMRRAIECGVDGMTVNFPDKLAQAAAQ